MDATVEPGATAIYLAPTPGAGAAWGAIPFPSDLFLDGDGQLTITELPVGDGAQEAQVAMLSEGLRSLDGAGVWSSVYIPVGGEVDPDSLAGNVHLVNLDDGLQAALDDIGGLPGDLSFADEAAILTESFGGMISGMVLAIEPNVTAATYAGDTPTIIDPYAK